MPTGPVVTRAKELHWVVRTGAARTSDGRTFSVGVDPVLVGSDPGAQIVLCDPEASAVHCELRAVDEGICVRDLGSTHGTFAFGLRIREAVVSSPTEITVGRSRVAIEPSASERVDVGHADRFGPLLGRSPRMRRVFGVLEKVAPTPLSLLILGETGTGKALVARAVHDASPRKGQPFVVVDCGAVPATLAESVLFGHEKGAFTGATEPRPGVLADADGGTILLDELGELPLDLQPKLLRALSERQVRRVGGAAFEPIDVRVLAATRRDLSSEVNLGRLRSDLYFRIAQARVELPPLRERTGDIAALVDDVCAKLGKAEAARTVLSWIEQRMGAHDWPGNVRELVNVASVAATLADFPGAIDDVLALALARDTNATPRGLLTAYDEARRAAVHAFDREYFTSLAAATEGNIGEMARQSGMDRHHVRAYLRKLGIDRG